MPYQGPLLRLAALAAYIIVDVFVLSSVVSTVLVLALFWLYQLLAVHYSLVFGRIGQLYCAWLALQCLCG